MKAQHTVRRWPLFLIASPAAVAIWSGWVALGGMCGFGLVQPFPGIVPWHLDTAITLPVGVEAYGAYALGAWLAPGTPVRARKFARRSSIGALVLGMTGQGVYHLLAAAHASRAPWPVVMVVSCMPVATLGFGATLTHLLRVPVAELEIHESEPPATPEVDSQSGPDSEPEPVLDEDSMPVRQEVPTSAEEAAKAAYVASVRGGNPFSERALADRFGLPRSQVKKLCAKVAVAGDGQHSEDLADVPRKHRK
jgi:hypothetical protein